MSQSPAARHQTPPLCMKLLKIGVVVPRNTRCLRLLLSSGCPDRALFYHAAQAGSFRQGALFQITFRPKALSQRAESK